MSQLGLDTQSHDAHAFILAEEPTQKCTRALLEPTPDLLLRKNPLRFEVVEVLE